MAEHTISRRAVAAVIVVIVAIAAVMQIRESTPVTEACAGTMPVPADPTPAPEDAATELDSRWSRVLGEHAPPAKCWINASKFPELADHILHVEITGTPSRVVRWSLPLMEWNPAMRVDDSLRINWRYSAKDAGFPSGLAVNTFGWSRDYGITNGFSEAFECHQLRPMRLEIYVSTFVARGGETKQSGQWLVNIEGIGAQEFPTRYGPLKIWFEKIHRKEQYEQTD